MVAVSPYPFARKKPRKRQVAEDKVFFAAPLKELDIKLE
jgi:hypothetical protein